MTSQTVESVLKSLVSHSEGLTIRLWCNLLVVERFVITGLRRLPIVMSLLWLSVGTAQISEMSMSVRPSAP